MVNGCSKWSIRPLGFGLTIFSWTQGAHVHFTIHRNRRGYPRQHCIRIYYLQLLWFTKTKKWHILPIQLDNMLSSVARVTYMQNVESVISLSKSCLLRNSGKKSSPPCCKSMLTDNWTIVIQDNTKYRLVNHKELEFMTLLLAMALVSKHWIPRWFGKMCFYTKPTSCQVL